MFSFIFVFLPSLLAVKIIEYFIGEINLKKYAYIYVVLLLLSAIINNLLIYLLFGASDSILSYLNTLPIFFVKCTLISLLVNALLAFIIVVIIKNVSFKIEIEKKK